MPEIQPKPTLPAEFLQMLESTGCQALKELGDVLLSTDAPVAVRLNTAKGGCAPAEGEPVGWCDGGYWLAERPQFIFDPALHQGLYYVQDASSMAHAAAVAKAVEAVTMPDGRSMRYLDACAAPGGKTTAAIDVLPPDAFVVANEFDPRRTSILVENLAKWGYEGVVVTREDATQIDGLDDFFDIIAADVPCSGEGMMRKDAQAVAQWSPALVAECAARQIKIVDNLWQALRPGGCFIYSTCTFNLDENERVVRHLINEFEAEPIAIEALDRDEIQPTIGDSFPSYRFIPGKVRGEGQYIALLRKPGEPKPTKSKSKKGSRPKNAVTSPAADLLTGDWQYVKVGENICAVRPAHAEAAETVARHCHVVATGIELGTVKGRDFLPSQQLAMARALNRQAFATAEVDRPTAIEYLRRNAVAVNDAPRGIVLLTFDGHPLGFIKNLGNRANNLYPANWRILSDPNK